MIGEFLKWIYNAVVFGIGSLRASFWRLFVKKMGNNVQIMGRCMLLSPGGIEIGSNVSINHDTNLGGHGCLKIGSFVMIGPNCNLLTANHGFNAWNRPMIEQEIQRGSIEIDEDVWLGANVVVLPNVKIGRGAVVGANAVVTKDVEPYSIVGGVPAKHLKYRFTPEEIQQALEVNLKACSKR